MMKLFLAIVAIATTVSFPVWAEENDNPGNMLNPEVNKDFVSDNALIYPDAGTCRSQDGIAGGRTVQDAARHSAPSFLRRQQQRELRSQSTAVTVASN
jgi:hypothetical protein